MAAAAVMAFSCVALGDVDKTVVIGIAVPSGGPKHALGVQIKEGAEKAVAILNATGGIAAKPIVLLIEDDDCTGAGGAAVAERFVERRAALVIGHPCSNAAMDAAKVYAAAGIWFVAVGADHPDLTAKRAGPTIFRYGGRDDKQAVDTAAVLAAQFPNARLAIVHDRTGYARKLVGGVIAQLKAVGITPLTTEGIVAGEKDYTPVVERLKTAQTTVLYFAGFPAELAILKSNMKTKSLDAVVIGADSATNDRLAPSSRLTDDIFMQKSETLSPSTVQSNQTAIISAFATSHTTDGARDVSSFAAALNVDADGDLRGPSFQPSARLCAAASTCR